MLITFLGSSRHSRQAEGILWEAGMALLILLRCASAIGCQLGFESVILGCSIGESFTWLAWINRKKTAGKDRWNSKEKYSAVSKCLVG